LVGVRGQVHLGVAVVVEDAALLGVEVTHQGAVSVIVVVKKALVRAHHLGVFNQTLFDALSQLDQTFNAIGWHKGVTQDGV